MLIIDSNQIFRKARFLQRFVHRKSFEQAYPNFYVHLRLRVCSFFLRMDASTKKMGYCIKLAKSCSRMSCSYAKNYFGTQNPYMQGNSCDRVISNLLSWCSLRLKIRHFLLSIFNNYVILIYYVILKMRNPYPTRKIIYHLKT